MDLTLSQPQILRRSIDQSDNVDFELGDGRTAGLIFPVTAATGNGRGSATVLASRSLVE